MDFDRLEMAALRARDDQQTAVLIDSAAEVQELGDEAERVAHVLLRRGLPEHMVVSNLIGFIAARLYMRFPDSPS